MGEYRASDQAHGHVFTGSSSATRGATIGIEDDRTRRLAMTITAIVPPDATGIKLLDCLTNVRGVTFAAIEETRLNHISFFHEQDLHYRGGGGGTVARPSICGVGGGGSTTRGDQAGKITMQDALTPSGTSTRGAAAVPGARARGARAHPTVAGYREIDTRDIQSLNDAQL